MKDEIIIEYKSEKPSQIIDEEKLLSLAIQSLSMLEECPFLDVIDFYKNYDSFHQFIDEYMPNVFEEVKMKYEGLYIK